jgi:hypothetical protein
MRSRRLHEIAEHCQQEKRQQNETYLFGGVASHLGAQDGTDDLKCLQDPSHNFSSYGYPPIHGWEESDRAISHFTNFLVFLICYNI